MIFEVVIPHLGATGADVRIVEWLVNEQDFIRTGTRLFVVEFDKATDEVPAFRDGYLRRILAPAGSEWEPGSVVALLTDTPDEPLEAYDELPSVQASSVLSADSPAAEATLESNTDSKLVPRTQSPRVANAEPLRTTLPETGGACAFAADDQPFEPSAEWLLAALRKMVLIRRYEEHLYHLFLQGQVPGTLHQCQGQEAVAVGVCSMLRNDDWVFSTHRPVGHLLAKGASLDALTAEIWGKATGCVGGKGGQMHLADFSVGAMVSNAIVGANIPIAVGAAMAFRRQGLDRVAVSFFGDGAANIGTFHEGLNLAAVVNAPVVFVCENNLYAASTPIASTMRIQDIADRAKSYGMPGLVVDGMDLTAVSQAARQAIARARAGGGPTLLECKTYRYRGHSRGDPCGYRDRQEHDYWQARDPIDQLRQQLQTRFDVDERRLSCIDDECQAAVEAAVAFAQASPDPSPAACLQHVFVESKVST